VVEAAFSPDGTEAVTANADGAARIWKLGEANWPVEDLAGLAELLSAHRVDQTGSLEPLDRARLRQLWQTLRRRHPGGA
jgi:WD40 repeat protein